MKTVLGIDAVVWPRAVSSVAAQEPSAAATAGAVKRLHVWVRVAEGQASLNGEAAALLEKMLKAMKLERQDVAIEVFSADEEVQLSGLPLVSFGSLDRQSEGVYVTHSLSDLLRAPELKRETWAVLQDVMKRLS